ncbi:unnamed protein product [Urochloa humidicola]
MPFFVVNAMRCMERYVQAEHAVAALSSAANVVFGGDMSWADDTDRPFPLPPGWFDAWTKRNPNDCSTWTYDGIWNEPAGVFNGYFARNASLQKRSDRFVCKLEDYRLHGVEMVGDRSLGPYYCGRNRSPNHIYVMPSCHRGLVLTVVPIK